MEFAEEIFEAQYDFDLAEFTKLELDITNSTGIAQSINLFEYSIQDVSVQYPFLQFSNPTDYNILIQELENNPEVG